MYMYNLLLHLLTISSYCSYAVVIHNPVINIAVVIKILHVICFVFTTECAVVVVALS